MSTAYRPSALRACIQCKRIAPQKTFASSGCPNCNSVAYTKNYFGTVAIFDPKETWVGKWQGIQKKGTYAITLAVTEEDIKNRDYDKDGDIDAENGGGAED